MLRTRLLTASAALALLAGPAFAQEATDPPPDPVPPVPAPAAQTPPVDPATEAPPTAQPQTPPAGTPPPEAATPPPPAQLPAPAPAAVAGPNVVDVLRSEGQFSTLLRLLDAAQLTSVLTSDADITILAPTDAAFAALPAGELDRLSQPENAQELRSLLLYHVINADVRADQVLNRRGGVQTGGGVEVMLDGSGGEIRADAASVTRSDLRGGNGAVFVLDQVLDPGTSQAEASPVQAPPEPPASAPDAPPAEPAPPPTETAPQPDPETAPDPGAAPTESPAADPVDARPPTETPPVDPAPDADDMDEPDGPEG